MMHIILYCVIQIIWFVIWFVYIIVVPNIGARSTSDRLSIFCCLHRWSFSKSTTTLNSTLHLYLYLTHSNNTSSGWNSN